LQIMGLYGRAAVLPATPGGEGVGRVLEVAQDVTQLEAGTTVFISTGATWAQQVISPAAALIPLPPGDVDQLAMLVSSPATAHLLLEGYGSLQKGDWLIQSAANSAVGSAVIQMAHARGLRTVNIVRRAEVVDELKALGADVVLVASDDLPQRISEATQGDEIKLALDAVGGSTFKQLVDALSVGGTLVSYSQVIHEPAEVVPADLIFKQITVTGFWLTHWFSEASLDDKQALFGHLIPMIANSDITLAVDRAYSLDEIKQAVTHSMGGRRKGKVMLHPNS